jgi:Icc-related predicted phosphoesterase
MKNVLLILTAMSALAASPALSDPAPGKHHHHQGGGDGSGASAPATVGGPNSNPAVETASPDPAPSTPPIVISPDHQNGMTKIRGSNKNIEFTQNKQYNYKTVAILGNHDTITVDQAGVANTARIMTIGNNDTADINQVGVANYAGVHMAGDKPRAHNKSNIHQLGLRNTIKVEQSNAVVVWEIHGDSLANSHCTAVAQRMHCSTSGGK